MEPQALSQITPPEARPLFSFTQEHIPEPKKLNPNMTWEEKVESIENTLMTGKCFELKERIKDLEAQLQTKALPTKKAAPVYLTDNIIQFPGERRGTHAN